jgi:hypothetical protein
MSDGEPFKFDPSPLYAFDLTDWCDCYRRSEGANFVRGWEVGKPLPGAMDDVARRRRARGERLRPAGFGPLPPIREWQSRAYADDPAADLLVVTLYAYGKRVPLAQIRRLRGAQWPGASRRASGCSTSNRGTRSPPRPSRARSQVYRKRRHTALTPRSGREVESPCSRARSPRKSPFCTRCCRLKRYGSGEARRPRLGADRGPRALALLVRPLRTRAPHPRRRVRVHRPARRGARPA